MHTTGKIYSEKRGMMTHFKALHRHRRKDDGKICPKPEAQRGTLDYMYYGMAKQTSGLTWRLDRATHVCPVPPSLPVAYFPCADV